MRAARSLPAANGGLAPDELEVLDERLDEQLLRALERGSAVLPAPEVRRALRERAGLSQQALAGVVGVTHSTLSRWEAGLSVPRWAAEARYAHVLGRLAERSEHAE